MAEQRRPPPPGLDDNAPEDLAGAVTTGVGWVGSARVGAQAMQFVASLVLARLVTPEDYGVFASILVIANFSVIFFELGIGAAIVHLRPLTDEDLSTAFWVNALAGVAFVLLLAAAGPVIADFFNQPALVYIAPITALTFTLDLGVCHRALLERQMQFRFVAVITVVAALMAAVVSISLAAMGLGATALALGPPAQSVVMTLGLWARVRWWPRHGIQRDSARRLWAFAGGVLGFNTVNYWSRNADNLLVGKLLGATSLGFYNRAYNLMLLPVLQVTLVVGRVIYPALAAMRDDLARTRIAYRRAIKTINAISVPLLVTMSATAPALVPLLWGPQWEPTVPLLQILAIAGIPQCLAASTGWIYQARGRTSLMFAVGCVNAALFVAFVAIGVQFGTQEVAWGVLAASWLATPLALVFACRLIELPLWHILADFLPTLVLSAGLLTIVWFLPDALQASREAVWVVGPQAVVGILVYLVGLRLLQPATFKELTDIARRRPQASA